ncbi:MAG: CaiB/BaiF CoA transferase family protein [Pseudomonadota bacterium]
MAGRPLEGVTVVDLTSVVLGPLATRTLAEMGARVIKVEAPEGDVLRHVGPARSPGMGAVFLNTNRGKESLVLDLTKPAAREALDALVARADVFVHSLRPQAAAKLGLEPARLLGINPRLVHCSAWGFRSDGPYATKPAYDDVIQAISGVADLAVRTGDEAPRYAPTILADKTAALALVGAVGAALFQRERTGRGVAVEVAMFETLSAYVLVEHLAGAVFEPPLGPMGYARILTPHRRPYATADGHVTVMPYNTRQWQRFFEVMDRDDLVHDPRVTDAAERSRRIAELYGLVADCVAPFTIVEVLARMERADVPAMRVHTLESLLDDPHHRATGFFELYEHPSEGRLRGTRPAIRFDGARVPSLPGAPRLGEHGRLILEELGLDPDQLAAERATRFDR